MQKAVSPRGIPRFVGREEVAEALGYSLKTLSREIQRGHVPRPVQISPNRVAWPVEVIQDLLRSRIARVTDQAVTDPTKLSPEPVENAVAREMARQLGTAVDPEDVIFGVVSKLSKGESDTIIHSQWLALWHALEERFGKLSQYESIGVIYGLFPAMRPFLDAQSGDRKFLRDGMRPIDLALLVLASRDGELYVNDDAQSVRTD